MKNIKILHLANDEKFIDQALKSFERAAPGSNELYVDSKKKLTMVKSPAFKASRLQIISGALTRNFSKYDIVVLHSLNPSWFSAIKKLPKDSIIIWMGWGYDYYDMIYQSRENLFLPLTAGRLKKNPEKTRTLEKTKALIKRIIYPSKKSIIKKIDIFSPVLPEEYSITKSRFAANKFPRHAIWNYGNLEDDLIRGFENDSVTGDSILVGNSATPENNHIDAFDLLSRMAVGKRKIISPLSYGDPNYRELITDAGLEKFGDNYIPLTKFMPISEYVSTLKSCSFVIMNHLRQQAVGNIVIMLHLGAKVFLQEKCPTFDFFKSQGAIIFTIQELEKHPEMLDKELDKESVATNRRIVTENWSRSVSDQKTQDLLKMACSIRHAH